MKGLGQYETAAPRVERTALSVRWRRVVRASLSRPSVPPPPCGGGHGLPVPQGEIVRTGPAHVKVQSEQGALLHVRSIGDVARALLAVETREEAFDRLLRATSAIVSLRSLAIVDAAQSDLYANAWYAAELRSHERDALARGARQAYDYLTGAASSLTVEQNAEGAPSAAPHTPPMPVITIPLVQSNGVVEGVMQLGIVAPASVAELAFTDAVAGQLTVALARIHRSERMRALQERAEAHRRQLSFLVDASAILAAGFCYEGAIEKVLALAVEREVADGCVVELLRAGEVVRIVAGDARAAEGAEAVVVLLPVADEAAAGTMRLHEKGHLRELDAVFVEALAQCIGVAVANGTRYREACATADASNDAVAMVSHDLRNPLATILAHTRLMLGKAGPPESELVAHPSLAVIMRVADVMVHLINNVLDEARAEHGRLLLERRPYALASLVADALAVTRLGAASKQIELCVEIPASLPLVPMDPGRILQVVSNLIDNAVKFTPPGGRVTVRAEIRGGALEVSVTDTGIGIAEADVPHIFHRFWRSSSAASTHPGLGLGLAIVHSIVEAHHGHICARSALGEGTTLTFTLPLASDDS